MIIYSGSEKFKEEAAGIASRAGLRMLQDADNTPAGELMLRFDDDGVSLVKDKLKMRGDLALMLPRISGHNLNRELLVRAAGKVTPENNSIGANTEIVSDDLCVKRNIAIDATAGMGEDSLLLAAAGYEVLMFEKDPVIAALLKDAIRRAKDMAELSSVISRMHLIEGDSISLMNKASDIMNEGCPEIIYLDPMFPERTKSSLVKKKFQLLHYLEKPCDNEEELLSAAMGAKPRKIVIKRPLKAPYLAGIKPSYSLNGKTIRYDVIVNSYR